MARKPLYGKILASSSFRTRKEAEDFAKKIKSDYKQIEESIKFDITRTPDSQWKAVVYFKI